MNNLRALNLLAHSDLAALSPSLAISAGLPDLLATLLQLFRISQPAQERLIQNVTLRKLSTNKLSTTYPGLHHGRKRLQNVVLIRA